MNLAPIVLFVYNRPEHTRKTVEALRMNVLAQESDLIIFSDAPKNSTTVDKVSEVRDYVNGITGFKSVQVVGREKNMGLAASVIQGVSDVINRYGHVIVLEDDLVTSPYFLTYMNEALSLYQDDDAVISVHAYNYPIKLKLPQTTFFLKGADCWGWATWKRGWDLFEKDGSKLLEQLSDSNLESQFDFNNTYPYTNMLRDQIAGKNDSWAIRWYASAFLKNKYTLYPTHSLVHNIGLDSSGTHSGNDTNFNGKTLNAQALQQLDKIDIVENQEARKSIELFFKKNLKPSLRQRIVNRIFK